MASAASSRGRFSKHELMVALTRSKNGDLTLDRNPKVVSFSFFGDGSLRFSEAKNLVFIPPGI